MPPAPQYYFGRMNEILSVVDTVTGSNPGHVAILGAPGMGKTSLALVVMHQPQVLAHYHERRYFASCEAALGQSSCLVSVAGSLGLAYSNAKAMRKSLSQLLGTAPALLVLDNFESCWEAREVRSLAEEELQFLGSIAGLTLIVTLRGSERPYGIPWAQPFFPPLGPLDDAATIETFLTVSGMGDSTPGIRRLVEHLGNIPLAVVLMANLAQYESIDVLIERWNSHKTSMLQRGNDQSRLTSLDVSISLSIHSPRMQADADALPMLSQLSLLPRGVVDSDMPLWDGYKPRALSTLFRTTLAHISPDKRVYVLPPIRSFILQHHSPSADCARPVYDHYFQLAELLRVVRSDGAKQTHVVAAVAREVENIESVIRHALSQGEQRGVQAAVRMCSLHRLAGLGTGPELLQSALRNAREAGLDELVAELLYEWAVMCVDMGVPGEPRALYRESRDLFDRVGNRTGMIDAGCLLTVFLDPEQAIEESIRLRTIAEELADPTRVASCSRRLGQAYERAGRMADARAGYAHAVELLRGAGKGKTHSFAMVLIKIAVFDSYAGDLTGAIAQFIEALPVLEAVSYMTGVGIVHTLLGKAYLVQGRFSLSVEHFQRSLAAYRTAKYKFEAVCLSRLAIAQLAAGDDGAAEQAIESAERLSAGSAGDAHSRGFVLRAQGRLALHRGDFPAARALLHSARILAARGDQREADTHLLQAETLIILGEVERAASQFDDASACFVSAALLWRKYDKPVYVVLCLCELAEVLDDDAASVLLEAVMLPLQRFGCRVRRAGALLLLAGIAQRRGDSAAALRGARSATRLFEEVEDPWGVERASTMLEQLRVESR
ncbi:TPR-like protein [Auricularia subglabra TFB-10046 SS5]|nr:TPR-like protein [Auricularia subglabra TFB-10046 SS5]